MNDLIIRPVHTPADFGAFYEAGERGQATNPHWIAPARQETTWAFDPKSSPLMRENDLQAFVAYRQGQPVGRIVAILNSAHQARYQDATGHFGMIDAIDDVCVFAALLDAAAVFLKERGMCRMAGPFSLSINHESGLLVAGFEEAHVVRTNHAPPFYRQHIEALGMKPVMDLLAYVCSLADTTFPERVSAIASRYHGHDKIHTQGLSLRAWSRDFPRILDLYNDAWRANWGALPVSPDEAKFIAKLMLPVSKPDWIRIATYRGEDVAILSMIPDVNEAMRGLNGRLLPFGWAKLMARIHLHGTKMVRIPMIGVASEWRGTRIGSMAVSMLLAESLERARKGGAEECEISWMLENNHAVLNLVKSLPARHTRTFRIYEKML